MHATLPRTRTAVGALVAPALLAATAAAAAPTQVKPGFNVFSTEQDIEIGRQSAAQAERQLPLLEDRDVQRYVESVFDRLSAQAPGAHYPYQIRVVNTKEINAFALPGGFVYVNRGAIAAARTEGELAGVLAHEISHVALRHGTANATKSYMTQAGLGVLGGILTGGRNTATSQIINVIGGLGLNAVFLKYSRDAETQADVLGSQVMAKAGYDPMEMAHFFQVLEKEGGSQGRAAQFFSDHPAPANRESRIQQEAQLIGAPNVRAGDSAGFTRVQADLRAMPAAPSTADLARTASGSRSGRTSSGRAAGAGRVEVEPPSGRYVEFRQRDDFFDMQIPSNWRAYEAQNGFGVTLAPEGGIVDQGNGQDGIVYGVIVNHYDPFAGRYGSGRSVSLDQATSDVIDQIRQSNSYLRVSSSAHRQTVDGAPGTSTVLSGTSPLTGEEERVTVVTREMGDGHVLYALLIAPGRDYATMQSAFTRMLDSLRVNDDAAHAASR